MWQIVASISTAGTRGNVAREVVGKRVGNRGIGLKVSI